MAIIKRGGEYWSFRNEVEVTEGIAMKGRRIIIPSSLQKRALDQLDVNHMGIEQTRLLAHESMYWINIDTYVENVLKIALYVLIFRPQNTKKRCCHMRYKADHFIINNKHYLCIVDYQRKFQVIKYVRRLIADNLIKNVRLSLHNMDFP